MARPPRISRSLVVAEALALVEEKGAGGLSMRALARRLGVDPMAVYRHVRDKADLLGAVCDAALGELAPIDPEGPARQQLRAVARGLYDLLVSRPSLLPVLAGAPATPASLAIAQRGIASLVRAGVAEEAAATVFSVVFSYVLGAATVTVADPPPATDQEALLARARELLGDADPPHMAAAASLLQEAEDFDRGLDLVLAGFLPGEPPPRLRAADPS